MKIELWIPVFDPLAILEKATEAAPIKLKDPIRVFFGHSSNNPVTPWLPASDVRELESKYGHWAVMRAFATVPTGRSKEEVGSKAEELAKKIGVA